MTLLITPEGATDLLVAITSLGLARARWPQMPGITVALLVLASAASLGVARFSGAAWAVGPHQFAVLVSSTAAVPLLAWCLRWPDSLPSLQPRAACIAIVFGGALGVALVGLLGFTGWGLLCLLLAVGLLLGAAWIRRQWAFSGGVAALLAAGVVQSAKIGVGGVPSAAVMHVLLALGLLLAVRGNRPGPATAPLPEPRR